MLSFLRDKTGGSPARYELQQLLQYNPADAAMLLAYFSRLAKGDHSLVSASKQIRPDLYWQDYNGIGAIYAYDGNDIVLIKVGYAPDETSFQGLLREAEASRHNWNPIIFSRGRHCFQKARATGYLARSAPMGIPLRAQFTLPKRFWPRLPPPPLRRPANPGTRPYCCRRRCTGSARNS
jgi:hypothetical protein